MDTSDVEMKDATEQPNDPHNEELHPQNGSDDVPPVENDDKLPHSVTGEGIEPAEVGTQENLVGVAEPKNEVDAARNTESELTSENSKLSAEVGTQENLVGLTEPKNDVDAVKNIESGLESLASKEPAELGTQESLDGVTEPKDVVDAAKLTENELESRSSKEIANELKIPAENVDHDQQLGEKTGEDQKIKENSEPEKTSIEKGTVPGELTVEKASHNGTGVGEKKVEPSDDVVLKSENEGMVNEPKQSEKMVPPSSSLADGDTNMSKIPKAERECSDANQNSTEAVVDAPKDPAKVDVLATASADTNASLGTSVADQNPATPLSMVKGPSTRSGGQSEELYKNMFTEGKIPGDVVGTPEEQAAFIRELERFYRERATEFKAPKFYGTQLNCLKLWRSVIRLGGYDRVTGSKLWRQVGESFHPPKTCTTVSWTFRIFYEKALLEYERYMTESGGLQLPQFASSDPSSVDEILQGSSFQPLGSGRARRDSATRAMQGWHSRQDNSEGGDQMMQDKNGNNMLKREKSIKSIGSLKQKRPDEVEHPMKAARTEQSKQLVTSVVDVGPPADWVRINVRETKDCYEVYALVPGLLREEVRIQSDPAGRLVITGQPEQPDNPWGITAFKKVVSLPGRIDPLQTSAVVSLHGRLFVRVPFEQ